MTALRLALPALLLAASAAPGFAQTVESALTLNLGGDAEKHSLAYNCDTLGQLDIVYINAAPNFLALLPYEGDTLIFTTVLSGSGVRYVSGQYEWWTKGAEGTLRDLTAEEGAPPLATCAEITNIP